MKSVKSFLSTVGADFKKGLSAFVHYAPIVIEDAQKVEQEAAPVLTLAFPGVAPGILATSNVIIAAALQTEQKFAAMGQQTGSGPQKLAEVVSIVGPQAEHTLASLGLSNDQATVEKWINGLVGALNSIPAASTTTTQPAAAAAAA